MPQPIVDPHVHLWRPDTNPWYPGLHEAGMDAIAHDFLPADYRAQAEGLDVSAIVHVSATTTPGAHLLEARWIQELAAETGWPAATVGTIDPAGPWSAVAAELDAQAQSPLLRGVRVLYGLEPDSELAARLLRRLADDGLVFDLVTHPAQAPAWRRLLDTVPDLVVVLEHAGWPEDTDDRSPWRQAMRLLAERPNTYCKISGLAMSLHSVAADVQRPWIDGCIEAFGVDRCMFASNFPVDALFGPLVELYDTYRSATADLPDAERDRLFAGTARAVYRI